MQRCGRLTVALDDDATTARTCLLGSDKSTSESRPALHFLSTENLPIAERNTLRHELAMQREGFRVTTPFVNSS